LAVDLELPQGADLWQHMLVPLWSPMQLPTLYLLANDLCARSHARVGAQSLSRVLRYAQVHYLATGDRPRAEELWREGEAIASHTGDAFVVILPELLAAFRAILDGELDTAVERAVAISRRADELGMAVAGNRWRFSLMAAPLLWMGENARLSAELDVLATAMGQAFKAPGWQAYWTGAVGQTGTIAASDARIGLAARKPYRVGVVNESLGSSAGAIATALELAIDAGERDAALRAAHEFEGVVAVPIMDFGIANVSRLVGAASVLCGDVDAARQHFTRGLEWARAIRYRPEACID
jgi:hypothetical protein